MFLIDGKVHICLKITAGRILFALFHRVQIVHDDRIICLGIVLIYLRRVDAVFPAAKFFIMANLFSVEYIVAKLNGRKAVLFIAEYLFKRLLAYHGIEFIAIWVLCFDDEMFGINMKGIIWIFEAIQFSRNQFIDETVLLIVREKIRRKAGFPFSDGFLGLQETLPAL